MPIADPGELVAAFKKSGEFDKLRRELLADSQRSVRLCFASFVLCLLRLSKSEFDGFKTRIEELARERMESMDSGQLAYMAPETLHKVFTSNTDSMYLWPRQFLHQELMQQVNRFPIVERFASEVPMLSEGAFKDGIRTSIQRILHDDRGQNGPPPADLVTPAPSQPVVPSVKEGEEASVAPVLPTQESVVPLVPRGSSAEPPQLPDGKKMDAIDRAPLTSALDTVMSDPVPTSSTS
ncbi:hypothetical protein B0H16DRAFT_1499038 [Mycena metata]|uniref:BOD1/SHG1 domain-containing protein n=1 Tax=Mycena metata TaxID=1033252 RepID=A0AAD7NZC4_9AGAR|nr:hypothetical protein B0H16DRAFT_1499038 [Mycena metata]